MAVQAAKLLKNQIIADLRFTSGVFLRTFHTDQSYRQIEPHREGAAK